MTDIEHMLLESMRQEQFLHSMRETTSFLDILADTTPEKGGD